MSEPRVLTPLQIAEARRLWESGAQEKDVATAVGCGISTFRRHRSPGRQLADLPARPHSARNSGRRSMEVPAVVLWQRAAVIRTQWTPAIREERSKGFQTQENHL